jgi:hypothetical protein
MPDLTRNAQVLRYLLQVAPGIGHTKLAKFAYLADLEARRYLGRQISEFEYVRDQHGPFDATRFFAARNELKEAGYITENEVACGPYAGYEMFPTGRAPEYEFGLPEVEVLRYVALTYFSKTAKELCDEVVYKTEPMLDSKMGRPLRMDKVDRNRADRHAFDFQRVLAGEASAEAGRVRPLADVLNELRAGSQ